MPKPDNSITSILVIRNSRTKLLCKNKTPLQLIWRDRYLYLIILPVLIHLFIFQYLPMFGLLIAFRDYNIGDSLFALGSDAKWVGLKHFIRFFNSIYFTRVIKNTFLNSGVLILFGFWVPIAFALLLNEIKNKLYKRVVQTLSYMPYFVSTVIVAGIVLSFLSAHDGIINTFLRRLGMERIAFMNESRYFRPIYAISSIWQTFGWSAIIYLASMSAINPELYEASKIDGANRWQQLRHITIPGIIPTISILLILAIGSVMMSNTEIILLLYNPAIYDTADVIGTFTYREGIRYGKYSYATAVGIFTAAVNFMMLSAANRASKKISSHGLW
jgi:putative aldouronate transport system permease protein